MGRQQKLEGGCSWESVDERADGKVNRAFLQPPLRHSPTVMWSTFPPVVII